MRDSPSHWAFRGESGSITQSWQWLLQSLGYLQWVHQLSLLAHSDMLTVHTWTTRHSLLAHSDTLTVHMWTTHTCVPSSMLENTHNHTKGLCKTCKYVSIWKYHKCEASLTWLWGTSWSAPNTTSFQENKYGSRNRIFLQKLPYGKIKNLTSSILPLLPRKLNT